MSNNFSQHFKNIIMGVRKMKKYRQKLLEDIEIYAPFEQLDDNSWDKIENLPLSEEFIREFRNFLNIHYISTNGVLSEDFIREFSERVNWQAVARNRTYSIEFMLEFKNEFDFDGYFINHNVDFFVIKKFISKTFFLNINEFQTKHLTESQKLDIQNLIDIKSLFIK